MDRYMRDFRDSFMDVRDRFFLLRGFDAERNIRDQEAEDNFTSELRHVFKTRQARPENALFYEGLETDMTPQKNIYGVVIKPDLVLHAEQDNQDRQLIFAEVKVGYDGEDLRGDLRKLERAISTELNFRYAVMIVVNESLSRTERHIREFVGDRFSVNSLRQLYLFHAVRRDNNRPIYNIKNFRRIRSEG